jgi:hypothetical protein
MKSIFVSILACLTVLLNLVFASAAQAETYRGAIALPNLPMMASLPVTKFAQLPQPDLLQQLETEILPQIEKILSPEQREQLKSEIVEAGDSFRKAFKSLSLTPQQKGELGSLFKTLPKKDIFASLSPDQKKELFTKKKEMFMPTAEEITEKITTGMKKKEQFMPNPEAVSEKISAGMKKMQTFKPTPEDIAKKISDKMSGAQ